MNKIHRDYCVFTHNKDLELLYKFSNFPIFMGCVETPPEKDLFADMDWHISKSSGSLQLNPLIPQDVLYHEQHSESVGGIWTTHHEEFAKFINSFNCSKVFEIGGALGILARNFQRLQPNTEWIILEPNPRINEDINVKVIKGFFDSSFKYNGTIDCVVHSHVFEHIYFPEDFVKQLSVFIPEDKYHFFSIPNMMSQLKSFYTNCLNFEHTCFLIEPYVDNLLSANGFEIITKKYFGEHSIFYATKRTYKYKQIEPFPNLYMQNKKLFNDFVGYHKALIYTLNKKMNESQYPIYLFGAHVFSQFLIAFGLNTEKIVCILDNGSKKIGKRLYGTKMRVESPKILKDASTVSVILKAGIYNEEIMSDILENINPHVEFWE